MQTTNELLNKIGDTSRETIDSMSDIVWVAHPKNDESEKLFQRLSNFGYEIFGHMATNFYFYTDPSIANLVLPISIRKNLYLICKEALNNTAKYANAKNVELLIKKENKHIVVVVKDDGVGFDNINFIFASQYVDSDISLNPFYVSLGYQFPLSSFYNVKLRK